MKSANKILISAMILTIVIIISFHLVSAVAITDVSTSPSEVAPGSKFSVDLTVTNDLNDDINDVEVSLDLSQVQFSPVGSSTQSETEIREDKSREFSFDLKANPDISGGSYKIPVTVKYKVNGNLSQPINSFISVLVSSKPVYNLDSDSVLIQNQKGSLDIKITNIGLTQAKFLEMELGAGNYNILSAPRVYIGNLDSDDFDTASYSIYIKSSGITSFPVTLRYRDSANKEYIDTQAINLKVYSQDEAINLGLIAKSNTGLYILIIVLVIGIYIVYRIIRGILKRRKKKLENEG